MLLGRDNLKGYILGEHLPHTFSPQIHAMLADYSYGVMEVAKEDLEQFMTEGNFDFLNVTIPYKKSVIPYLSKISPVAEKIGAINTIVREKDGSLTGHNTDYYGFEYTLIKSGISVEGAKVLVLGSGGASMPVRAVLESNGASFVITISRSGEDNYENISRHYDADIIVNTTPVGMYPSNGEKVIELSEFTKCRGVIDIIYNPDKTALLLDAEMLGIAHIGGLPMLVAQAKRAAEIFTGDVISDDEIDKITSKISFDMKNIILVGMPGCGKSTIGNLLANKLSRPFFDSDIEFQKKYDISPAEAIKNYGEAKFRKMEHEIIKTLGKTTGNIIATGGGVVTQGINYAPLHQNGTIFFIERKLNSLSSENRPLSQSVGLHALYEKRLPLYINFSDYRIDNNGTEDETVNKIIESMKAGN